jgi:hypothetical protein
MVEELGGILRNGFETWKKNLVICLPFVFSLILTFIGAFIIIVGALMVVIGPLLPSLIPQISNTTGEIPPEVIQQLQPLFLQNIGLFTAAIVIAGILMLVITVFFTAGAIGMAKEATVTGKTRLSDMTYYGRRKFVSLLGANIIVGVIVLAGVVFLIPGLVALTPTLTTSQAPPDVTNMATFVMLGLGFLIMGLYMLIVSIIFAIPPYAVVLDDLGAVDGVKRGFHFFTAHKVDVFLLWLVVLVITIVASIILGNIPLIGQWLSMAVSVLIIEPLSVLWWSRLYLSEAGIKSEIDREQPDF